MICKPHVFLLFALALSSCAGTVRTTQQASVRPDYKSAYIVSAEHSNYIKFKMGIITPFFYVVPADGPAQKREVIGDTDLVIEQELLKYGVQSTIGQKDDPLAGYDLVVFYNETWRWDFNKILDKL